MNNTIVNAASGVITLGDKCVEILFRQQHRDQRGRAWSATRPEWGAIVAINDDNTVSNLAGATITPALTLTAS